jgi:hypothetical protein
MRRVILAWRNVPTSGFEAENQMTAADGAASSKAQVDLLKLRSALLGEGFHLYRSSSSPQNKAMNGAKPMPLAILAARCSSTKQTKVLIFGR